MSDGLRIRHAAKAIVTNPEQEVLLVRFEFPSATVWALPGGGLEPGETHEQALVRELAEELGLTDVVIGPHVWTRRQVIPFPDGRWDGQEEHIHVVQAPGHFEPNPQLTWEQLHQEYLYEIRWWSTDELTAATGTLFAPRRLPDLFPALLDEGPSAYPIDVGA